jgi:DNA-binding FadR family transcriptional regulator
VGLANKADLLLQDVRLTDQTFLGQVEHAVHRFGETTYAYPGRREISVEEHQAIVDAIVASEPEKAERLAIEHMREARRLRIQMLAEGRV